MSEPSWMQEARKLEGLKEIVGSKDEPRVVEFFAEAGNSWVKDDETAWCAAFANAMLARAGYKGTGKLNARSFLDWGQVIEEHDAQPGDLVILKRGDSTWQGHVTFLVSIATKTFKGLGGNQSNAVTVATFKLEDVLGFRRPTERIGTKAPGVAASNLLKVGMMDSERVRTVQAILKRLGYPIGIVDGDFGNLTRDAVLAWKADNDLPLSPDVSPGDVDRMESSGSRPLSEARLTATTAEVKAVDRSVKSDDFAVKAALTTAGAVGLPTVADQSGLTEGLKVTSDNVGQAKNIVDQVTDGARSLGFDVAAFISSHSTLLVIGGLAVVGYFVWKSMKARVEDHREGRKL